MMQQLNLIEKNESIRLPSESEWNVRSEDDNGGTVLATVRTT